MHKSKEVSSGSGGSAGTSLEVNNGDVATDDQISVAPSSPANGLDSNSFRVCLEPFGKWQKGKSFAFFFAI